MTDPKIIEDAAERYVQDSVDDKAYPFEFYNIRQAFKAGYAKASKDIVPVEVVQKLVEALESISAPRLTDDELLECDSETVVNDTKIAREALAEFQTWKEKRRG